MRLFGSHATAARAAGMLAALTLGAVAADPLSAQQREAPPQYIERSDGTKVQVPRRRGFDLFGSGDIAVSGLKGVGAYSFSVSNYGPPLSDLGGTFITTYPQVLRNGGWFNKYFEITIIAGASRHEFRKIRQVYPGIGEFATGDGYTLLWNAPLLGGQGEIAPADNSLGTFFSGVQTLANGSCRDHRATVNEGIVTGSPLLAGSDCPETWGTAGWQGPRYIPDTAFANLKAQLGDAFDWQYWKVDPNQMGGNLGNFSTFGVMTDHTNEILAVYGGATPRGSGPARIEGYPLGLDFRFEAMSFSLPALANTYLYQLRIINRSEDVYGAPIDYDSLYAGLEVGFLDTPQAANTYFEPGRNAVLSANGAIHTNCNGARAEGVQVCTQGAGTGFTRGSSSIVVLKSPIGDMRNKLYTRPGRFNEPNHPRAGDTITFNHGHKCGFGDCIGGGSTIGLATRPHFGLISSRPLDVLAGRSVNELTPDQYYFTFRDPTWPLRSGRFPRFAPGADVWDFDKDGVADTIYFDTCDEIVNNANNVARGRTPKCVSTWSDSVAGGMINNWGNVGGAITAGPFALKAGDTTAFIFAFNGAPDSISIEAATNNAIEAYLNFWTGPTGPPNPTVVATNITRDVNNDPTVQITYTDAPEVWVDPFLLKYAADLETSTAPDQIRLRNLNPTLVADIRARAASGRNFKTLYVYKSCNGGTTWTADADCIGDPAQDAAGNRIGNGWRPYRIIQADSLGSVTNLFQDANVTAGRTYLYSFISQSRGFTTTVLDSTGTGATRRLISRTLVVADSILNPVNTSGPNTANVYVPISLPAGTSAVSSTVERGGVPSTLPVTVVLSQAARGGTYTGTFGNRFILSEVTNLETGAVTSTVQVQTFYPTASRANGSAITGGAIAATQTFTSSARLGVSGLTRSGDTTTTATTRTIVDTLSGLGFLLSREGEPLYISASPSTAETTPTGFLTSPQFPGFRLNIDTTRVGDYISGSEFVRKPPNDSIPNNVYAAFAVQWDEARSVRRNSAAVGTYEFTWSSDAYGPGAPFALDFSNRPAIQTAVTASLEARPSPTIGDTTTATRNLIRAALLAGTTADQALANRFELVPGEFPFTVRNSTFNRPVRLAMMKRTSLPDLSDSDLSRTNTILLGNGVDTIRVAIDSLTWVPGDYFVMLEDVQVDSVVAGRVITDSIRVGTAPNDTVLRPAIKVTRTIVSFVPANLACSAPRQSCNPLRLDSPGATGYLTYVPETKQYVTYEAGFVPGSSFTIVVNEATPSNSFTASDRARIRVVPNPYVVADQYDVIAGRAATARVYLTNVPAEGLLRVYSVSGQLLQQITWTAADLNGTGDLPYNLRTREGTDLASGLYIWTIQARDSNGKQQLARGKFVVIR